MNYSNQPIIVFLPCRRGSERIKDKNTRLFAGIEGGMTSIKMQQLVDCPEIDNIVISTDDPKVADICQSFAEKYTKPIKIFERPPHLATSNTSTDELINYVPEIISSGIVLWTHVTSPFVDSLVYSQAIRSYRDITENKTYDSLISVTKVQKFLWNQNQPINYDRTQEKWPRTQTLPTLYEVNSAIFLASIDIYTREKDRIGSDVYLFELTKTQSMDVDWEDDFKLAEALWHSKEMKQPLLSRSYLSQSCF